MWEKIGNILRPRRDIRWLSASTGPAFARQVGGTPFLDLYVAGRDSKNRSSIGRVRIDVRNPHEILSITPDPVFSFGELGAFDENGVSYPYLVRAGNKLFMYYVGWVPAVLTPFQNHLGLAVQRGNGRFQRVSRAPILERNNDDFLSIGSCCVLIEKGVWRMWYTSFLRWGRRPDEPKHTYVIKYAESSNGTEWRRENRVCIDLKSPREYAICRPCVLKIDGKYHMWYSYRGDRYRIGHAVSKDGLLWKRRDRAAGLDVSSRGWDSRAVCYGHVFKYNDHLYMVYNGNDYGRSGLGLARLREALLK